MTKPVKKISLRKEDVEYLKELFIFEPVLIIQLLLLQIFGDKLFLGPLRVPVVLGVRKKIRLLLLKLRRKMLFVC
jgi:hypothetical protein